MAEDAKTTVVAAASPDHISVIKGGVQNLGQLAAQNAAPGGSLSGIASPKVTTLTALSNASMLAIVASTTRRGLEFHSSDVVANTNIWLMPQTTAVVKQGILLVPGSRYQVPATLAANAGFSAIASSGAANTLTIVEFF